MKLLTTAAMALALTGAAAVANADQPQNNNQKGQHQSAQKGGPPPRPAGQPHTQAGPPGGQQQHFAGPQGGQHGQVQQWNGQRGGPAAGGAGGQASGQQGYARYRGGPGAGGQANGQVLQGSAHYRGGPGAGGPGAGGQANGQVQRWNGGQRGAGFAGQPGARPGLGFQSHGLRPSDQGRAQFSTGAFARQYQAQRRFRFGGYRAWPAGWYLRSWNYGDFLPYGWFATQYYIRWGDYGLPPPPFGCEWIAQGPDALLVDIWTGEVLSVYRGVFYYNGY